MSETTDRTVIEVMARELGVPAADITPGLEYNSIPEWDSVAHITLASALEEAFGIQFGDDEIGQMNTVAKIQSVVASHVG